ncbi:hypothetical protein FQN55_007491 [Onygenales sp. PD_40]|nr:hypothetical protein FQN55_007491 [Onygenales sp. PD_40]
MISKMPTIATKDNSTDTDSPLTSLPTEILLSIAKHVGASELKANRMEKLLVCKYWYCIAVGVLMEDMTLSAVGLKSFPPLRTASTEAETAGKQKYNPRTAAATTARSTSTHMGIIRCLSVHLQRHSDWPVLFDSTTQEAIPDWEMRFNRWLEETGSDITRLANWLDTLQALERFRFQAVGPGPIPPQPNSWQALLFQNTRHYLQEDAIALMCRSIPTRRLRVLEIDTCGSAFVGKHLACQQGGNGAREHICPLIGKYVPSLGSLRVRMHKICPDIFGGVDGEYTTARKEVVVHLSLFDPLKGMTKAMMAELCSAAPPCGRGVLINKMIEGANAAATKMPNLKATLLYHTYPYSLMGLDCRTGQSEILDSGIDWLDNEDVVFADRRTSGQFVGVFAL